MWIAAAGAVATRLLFLGLPAWPDEAGFLQVGAAWRLGGTGPSVYGQHWVDRPPVLITAYGLAERLGGLQSLRLLGALAAGVTVLAVADLAGTLASGFEVGRAKAWAGVCAVALLTTPWHWAFMVDGELLAAPFVAGGMALTARGVPAEGWHGLLACAGGGALAAVALLTKQNFADVFVFAAALVGLRLIGRSLTRKDALRVLLGFGAGSGAALGAVCAWTIAHGTSLPSVWYAMYGFRLDAMRTPHAIDFSADRVATLAWAAVLSGLLLVLASVLLGAASRVRRDAAVGALLAVLAFDVFSVLAGGNYWLHYLLQPSLAAAALLGVLVAHGVRLRPVALACCALTVFGILTLFVTPPSTAEEQVGQGIRRAASPGDELVTVMGHSNVNLAAGLPSPYTHLWALPARTLDPEGRELRSVLTGGGRPAWFVSWRPLPPTGAPGTLAGTVHAGYRPVARICRRTIYLRHDLDRPVPWAAPRPEASRTSRCRSANALPALLRHLS